MKSLSNNFSINDFMKIFNEALEQCDYFIYSYNILKWEWKTGIKCTLRLFDVNFKIMTFENLNIEKPL